MDIGKPQRVIVVEPLEVPDEPLQPPLPEQAPEELPKPVPAGA